MSRLSPLIPSSLVASLLAISALASAALSQAGDADVQFQAVGPAGLKINGGTSSLTASEASQKLTITVPLNTLKTGIGLRDEHLKKSLEAGKHPNAVLSIERSKLKFPDDNKVESSEVQGQLTLHGVTKPVKFQYQVKRTGSDYHVQGKADINILDFNIEKPCYLGVCVDPNVKIKAKFKLRDS